MGDNFDIKAGFVRILKSIARTEPFITAFFSLVLGKREAAHELKAMLLRNSFSHSLNEIVTAHRMAKSRLNETAEPNNNKDKGLLRKIAEVPQKSMKFQSEVVARTLKKPGAVGALFKLIRSDGTDPSAWVVLAPAIAESAAEVAAEDEQMEAQLSEANIGPNSVNIMVGRFQPFTLGHLKCLKAIKDNLGVPTFLCVIPGNGDDKHPFRGKAQDDMFERLMEAHPDLIAGMNYVKNAFIEFWIGAVKEAGFEPVSWTCGTDRFEAYRSMAEKHGQKYGLSPEFQVHLVDRADDNISATSVRECLLNDDREGYMSQMPECLHGMYDELRQVMVGDMMPAQATALTEEGLERRKLYEALDKLTVKRK